MRDTRKRHARDHVRTYVPFPLEKKASPDAGFYRSRCSEVVQGRDMCAIIEQRLKPIPHQNATFRHVIGWHNLCLLWSQRM